MNPNIELANARDDDESRGTNYLAFVIDDVSYALEVSTVIEIIGMLHITKVPNVPHYVRGVINLRGKVIPVVDVRARFGIAEQEYHDRTCIIVAEVDETTVGLVVDAVSEVIDLLPEHMQQAPPLAQNEEGRCIAKIGKHGEDVKLILDARQLLSARAGVLMPQVAEASSKGTM